MEADLVDVKQLFSNMMRRVQPWILSHFIMWLDLKVAEYKVLGYMVLDKKPLCDKDEVPTYNNSSKTGTPSPASITSSEHMYVLPSQTTGNVQSADFNTGQSNRNPSPNISKDNKEYDNFAELVQNNKRKSISTMGIYVPEKLDTGNMQKCVSKSVQDQDLVGKDLDSCDNRPLENGLQNQRKQRKPGKVLHSIVNNLKQNCCKSMAQVSDSESVSPQATNQSVPGIKSLNDNVLQSSDHSPVNNRIEYDNGQQEPPTKVYRNNVNVNENKIFNKAVVSMLTTKANNRDNPSLPQESSDIEEENTPLYKSQQFSSLISLSRSRGRRRRSSNDEITYPLITMKDAEVSQTYNEEPRSQNLADFYFAQNQLDEQFAVRRARQSVCRMTNKPLNEKDGMDSDNVFPKTDDNFGDGDGEIISPFNKDRPASIKQERMDTSQKDDTSPDNSRLQNESPLKMSPIHQANKKHDSSYHGYRSNISQNIDRTRIVDKVSDRAVFVKSEPQNDEEYCGATIGGQYSDRLSNQSFSSEGDTTGYHDNSSQFEYHGDDIAEESYILSNSELYGEDYVGSPNGTPGMDNHDNKIIRPRAYKKRPVNCSQNLVPRDPSSGKFVCELCGGTFTNRSSYFRHKRIHGEKKFRCFLCDKAFHRKEHLQSHIHRHTKSFPLKCCQCNYESHSLDEASSHFQTTHNQDFKESP